VLNLTDHHHSLIAKTVKVFLGVEIRRNVHGYYDFQSFFRRAEIRDILDFVTTASLQVGDHNRELWLENVAKIFEEEHLGKV